MSEPVTILLLHIEDDPSLGELFGMMLRREAKKRGWTVIIEWAQTFAEGLARAKKVPPPDLIILDLGLPDSMPEETQQRIPELQRYGPVQVLTGRTETGMREFIERLGAGFSDKREAYASILERGISIMLDWFPKSQRAQERATRLRNLDQVAHSLRAQLNASTH